MKRLGTFDRIAVAKALLFVIFALGTASAFAEDKHVITIESDVTIGAEDDRKRAFGFGGEISFDADDADEIVAIGGLVKVTGTSKGEVLAIGGDVSVDVNADGDIVVMGGEVSVSGVTTQDGFVAGGEVSVDLIVADELFVAGGNVEILSNTTVAGNGSFFGGVVEVDGVFAGPVETGGGIVELIGQFAGDVTAASQDLTLDGYFSGDVEVTAVEISFGDNVQFLGDLTIKSPEEVELPEGVEVGGEFSYEYISKNDIDVGNAKIHEILTIFGVTVAVLVFVCLAIFSIGVIVVAASGSISRRGITLVRDEPWKAFGIGAGVLILMPIGLGILTAINDMFAPLFVLYGLVWLTGFAMGGYLMITLLFNRGPVDHSGCKRFGLALLGTFLLLIICIIPILGGLVSFAASIVGTGAYVGGLLSKDKPQPGLEPEAAQESLAAEQDNDEAEDE